MALLTCTDCQQPVSSAAIACPSCGRPIRDRSYLTPVGQVAVGGLALIACLAWSPLFLVIALALTGRLIARAARGTRLSATIAGVLILAVTIALAYLAPSYAVIVLVLGVAVGVWLVRVRIRAANSVT